MRLPWSLVCGVGLALGAGLGLGVGVTRTPARWNAEEREALRALRLDATLPLPADPTNRVADDARAAALGQRRCA